MDFKNILVSAASAVVASVIAVPAMVSFVTLQPASPGTAEVGKTNVTGNSMAARFGAGTAPTSARVQVNETGSLQGVRAVTTTSDAINAFTSSATGGTVKGRFTNSSASGKSVVGDSISATGNTIGGDFKSRSTTGGFGILARHIATTGPGIGVKGTTASGSGIAGVFINTDNNIGAEIGGPNGSLFTKGPFPRHQYAVSKSAAMVPIAYGYIGNTGGTTSGSGNFTSTYNAGQIRYEITIPGESYFFTSYSTVVTPTSGGAAFMSATSSGLGLLLVKFFDAAGTQVQSSSGFGFVVYKSDPHTNPPAVPDHGYDDDSVWAQKDPKSFATYLEKLSQSSQKANSIRNP